MVQETGAEVGENRTASSTESASGLLAHLLPLRQTRLADQVYELLLLRVARGLYPVGTRLPSEPKLCTDFGVSRPVVREALARLRLDKIVRSRRGSGTWVEREPSDAFASIAPTGSIAEIIRSYEFRAGIEAEAAALAAQRREPRHLQAMERAALKLATALEQNEVGAEADIAFHHAVAEAAGNPLFVQAIEMLGTAMHNGITVARRLKLMTNSLRLHQVLHEHEAVLDAISRQDPEAARDAMHRHITKSRDRMLGFVGD
ncbi:FadR/GntR family transcriptional regulator [Aquibaculum sediminis]|uniref:FadR/GntR family transcriptional regulator n=1 Tax=Aquibaculum sediminis TaxID=3231907 RepID=UPI0034538DC2